MHQRCVGVDVLAVLVELVLRLGGAGAGYHGGTQKHLDVVRRPAGGHRQRADVVHDGLDAGHALAVQKHTLGMAGSKTPATR